MSRYVPLDFFQKHFRVIDPEVLMEAEPTKYYDPAAERNNIDLSFND